MPLLVDQMFPSPYLSPQDLAAYSGGQPVVVTIERHEYRTRQARGPGAAELDWFLHFRELRKPMRLKPIVARQIEDLLGSDADLWPGERVALIAVQAQVPDPSGGSKLIWVINVDAQRPVTEPTLPFKTDITGAAKGARAGALPAPQQGHQHQQVPQLAPAGRRPAADPHAQAPPREDVARATVGLNSAAKVVVALADRGKTIEDVLRHIRASAPKLYDACSGAHPSDWPWQVLDVVRQYVQGLPTVRPPGGQAAVDMLLRQWREPEPTPASPPPATPMQSQPPRPPGATPVVVAGGVVDHVTGELITPDDDDIPF